MNRGAIALVPWALCATVACDPEVVVGYESTGQIAAAGASGEPDPPVPWSAGHETGTLEEWTADGDGWQYATLRGGSLEVVSEQAHTGTSSLKSSLTRTGSMEQAVVGRYATLVEGYYSAWFFLPSSPGLSPRVIMKLSSRDPNYDDIFDITLVDDGSGGLRAGLFEHAVTALVSDTSAVPAVPLDTWFELEVFYRSTPAPDGRVVVWQDGELIIDTGPRATGPDGHVVFIVGSVTENDFAEPLVLYVDDAQIRAGAPPLGM